MIESHFLRATDLLALVYMWHHFHFSWQSKHYIHFYYYSIMCHLVISLTRKLDHQTYILFIFKKWFIFLWTGSQQIWSLFKEARVDLPACCDLEGNQRTCRKSQLGFTDIKKKKKTRKETRYCTAVLTWLFLFNISGKSWLFNRLLTYFLDVQQQ